MNIDFYIIGKIKNKNVKGLIEEYTKRIKLFPISFSIIHLKDSEIKNIEKSRNEIFKQFAKVFPKYQYNILFERDGLFIDNEYLTNKINSFLTGSVSKIAFYIGDAYGFDKSFFNKFNEVFSFSKLTFPHELAAIVVVEQIYRTLSIIFNKKYHKKL